MGTTRASRAFHSVYTYSVPSLPPACNPQENPKGSNNGDDVDGVLPALAGNSVSWPLLWHLVLMQVHLAMRIGSLLWPKSMSDRSNTTSLFSSVCCCGMRLFWHQPQLFFAVMPTSSDLWGNHAGQANQFHASYPTLTNLSFRSLSFHYIRYTLCVSVGFEFTSRYRGNFDVSTT